MACTEQSSPTNCDASGCDYVVCTGEATACAELDEADCVSQPGCSWE